MKLHGKQFFRRPILHKWNRLRTPHLLLKVRLKFFIANRRYM